MKRNACQKCVFAVYNNKPHCGLRGFRSDFNVERCSAESDRVPNGYELQEDGYFSWVEKKKEYPKTYEECLSVLKIKGYDIVTYVPSWTEYEKALYQEVLKLRELIICRDAYWKLYGEEMGLGKSWEPSDSDYITGRYCIFVHQGNIICSTPAEDCPLTFPTEEMRDAFYENFKELIEECKELL